jgi:hypothetical protein
MGLLGNFIGQEKCSNYENDRNKKCLLKHLMTKIYHSLGTILTALAGKKGTYRPNYDASVCWVSFGLKVTSDK